MLSESNPEWKEFAYELERTGQKPRTNPDGDVGTSGFEIGFRSLTLDRLYLKGLHTTSLSFLIVKNVWKEGE